MTAGSISVPQIIPLRVPLPGKAKYEIDTNTPVEVKSDTSDVSIYYTLDGSTPDLFRKPGYGENNTLKYRGPFTLPEGKVTVKAMAVTKDGRQSGVVTKLFRVEYVQPYLATSDEDDEENFQKEYAKEISRQESQEGSVWTMAAVKKVGSKERNSTWDEAAQKFQDINDVVLGDQFVSPTFRSSCPAGPGSPPERVSSIFLKSYVFATLPSIMDNIR